MPRGDRKLAGTIRLVVTDPRAAARPDSPVREAYYWLAEHGEPVELLPTCAPAFETLREVALNWDPRALVVRSAFALRWMAQLQVADLVLTDDPRLAGHILSAPVPVLHLDGDPAEVGARIDRALDTLPQLLAARRRERDNLRRVQPVKRAQRQLADGLDWLLER
jgi:hypothetical protein